ncbi:MAG TPA: hypothetical protein PLZ30_14785 [Deltaproteobacteria bacterium]|nr:hypothetical protein [Deltaproteobacteria bacterium]
MKRKIFIDILILFLLLLFGCSSGSSGGGGDESAAESLYSGARSQATITADNAAQIILGTFYGSVMSSSVPAPFGAVEGGAAPETGRFLTPRYLVPPVENAIVRLWGLKEAGAPSALSAVHNGQINEPGDCGGSMNGTITIDDSTGAISGNVFYRNYCLPVYDLDRIYYYGAVEFAGTYDPCTRDLSLNMRLNGVTMSYQGQSIITSGTVTMEFTPDSMSIVLNTYSRYNETGKTHWYDNFTITAIGYDVCEEMSMSGRFYEPDHGYVDLSTEKPFVVFYGYDFFYSRGELIAAGAGNTCAKLTARSPITYMIEADTNGDGDYDKRSEILFWEEGYRDINLVDSSVASDSYEPDDWITQIGSSRNTIATDGTLQHRTLDHEGDLDLIFFDALPGYDYTIETTGCDTKLCVIFEVDDPETGTGEICDEGCEAGAGPSIFWQCDKECIAMIFVVSCPGSEFGSYQISVTESLRPSGDE